MRKAISNAATHFARTCPNGWLLKEMAANHTLKDLYAEKEMSTDKKDERKHQDKEEVMRKYYDVQRRKLEIDH